MYNFIANAPYKAIMIFNSTKEAQDNYSEPVFLFDAVTGVRRFTFRDYLYRTLQPHDEPHCFVKIYPMLLGSDTFDPLLRSDIEILKRDALSGKYAQHNKQRMLTSRNAFRNIWYAATKELIDP